MFNIFSGNARGWSAAALIAVLFALAPRAESRMLDLNHNGLSDVWEFVYNAQGLDPGADLVGDGLENGLKAVAGTNPFDVRSGPRISSLTIARGVAVARMNGALGKQYELQASETIFGNVTTNWSTQATLIARTNPVVTLSAPADSPAKFFRIVVSDVDTDGDGLNDWEEYQLGLDPFSPFSNGTTDGNGKPVGDYDYALHLLNLKQVKVYGMGETIVKSSLALYPDTAGDGTGLTGEYFMLSDVNYTNEVNFNPANLFLTRLDPEIDFNWARGQYPNTEALGTCVRWSGQVMPQYSEIYTFETMSTEGLKLWVNNQLLIDHWEYQSSIFRTNAIALQAGVRYDIRIEYFSSGREGRARLSWYSPSQPRQVIPASCFYPAAGRYAPGAVTSPTNALAFLGQPFSYNITGANSPFSFGATNLAPGLAVNPNTGVISGVPTMAGSFDMALRVVNSAGAGSATLHLNVLDTGSSVTREVWLGAAGTSITNIPLHLPASATNTLSSLEGISNSGDNYGERVRGYLTAPLTGNYYFWIAANNAAELWISNDEEPVNRVRRAYVSKATKERQWTFSPSQRSSWLALEAGHRYYLEILHKAGKGAGDHWSVGWLQDSSGAGAAPAGVVPGFVLSPYVDTPPSLVPGELYSASMLAQSGAQSSGVGSGSLRLSADGSQAVLRYTYSGLSSAVTGKHIHADTYQGKNSQGQIIFDIDAATPEADGSFVWRIAPSGPLSAADIIEIIKEGKSYLNVHTVDFPAGEINGHFTLANGTATFTPPPPPLAWTDDHTSSNSAARFLLQATFGPNKADIASVKSLGYAGWLRKQFKLPISSHWKLVAPGINADPGEQYSSRLSFNAWWQQSVSAPDQLRQRVAFGLSEIMVVSDSGVLAENGLALSPYYDVLLTNAFGNFRDLLKGVTLSPAMGLYLDMRRNDKADLVLGTRPNENYAREIMQLFSIGLNRMWPDGTLALNSRGELIPTYNQDVIMGYARVFTGWNYYQTNQSSKRLPINWIPAANYTNSMTLVPTHHELGVKTILDNAVLPAAQGSQADPSNPSFDTYGPQDLDRALDSIFHHENVGPFICRQLIQRLVTSNPSRDYLYRVVQAFNDNGAGVRGDMKAVITAILLDYEARSPAILDQRSYGKQREPILRATALARAFPAPPAMAAKYSQKGGPMISITTARPHRLSSEDQVLLSFTGGTPPASQIYGKLLVDSPTSFRVAALGVSGGNYVQSGSQITVSSSNHGLAAGQQIYLQFTSGGAGNGVYTVAAVPDGSTFTVTATDSASRSGECLFPNWARSSTVQNGTSITVVTPGAHGLVAGDKVFIRFPMGGLAPSGGYTINSVAGGNRFTVTSGVAVNQVCRDALVMPLTPPPLTRAGAATVHYSTWNMNFTDSLNSWSLYQSPLRSPTVFNFFSPDYRFPGTLASAGLTTPEFQLTTDISVVLQMNFLSGSIFLNFGNTNGLSSLMGGSGAITLDFAPWMTPAQTSDAGIPSLVDNLNTLLCAGQLSASAKDEIVNYVASSAFPYTAPTFKEMRDRVRAVAHLIVTSPEFTIQK